MHEARQRENIDPKKAAHPCAAALQRENALLKQKVVELEQLASRDTLTPLYNRRYFSEMLERWSARAHRYGGDYGIIFIDVDGLKAVNDRLGHAMGDKVLIAIANTLHRNIRRSDIAARLGGDEFAILLDSADAGTVRGKAEKLRREVSKLQIELGGEIVRPTISLGSGIIEPGKSAAEIMAKVDRRMYREKNANRNIAGPGD